MKLGLGKRLAIISALIFCVSITGTYLLFSCFAEQSAKHNSQYAQDALNQSISKTLDSIMTHVIVAFFGQVDSARPIPRDEMLRLARLYEVDEINIADTNGVWIASTENALSGKSLKGHAAVEEFLCLLNHEKFFFSQPFRLSASDATRRRKYLGSSFADNSGFVQIGIDEDRIGPNIEIYFSNLFDAQENSDRKFYLLAEMGSGEIRQANHGFKSKTLREAGFTLPLEGQLPSGMFHQTIEGMPCWCRYESIFGHIAVTLIPEDFYDDVRLLFVGIPALILIVFFTIMGIMYRGAAKARRAEDALRRAEEKRRAEDLAMARSIQKSALPSVFPPYPRDLTMDIFARMDPARDIGGDFYDFHYAGDGRLAFLVADVSGKGIPAAMLMMKAKTILRTTTFAMADLAEAIAEANERLCEDNDADMFVTCWLGVLDERTGTVRYVCAGHNPPYICRATGKLEMLDNVSGMALGGMSGMPYRSFEAHLQPGDTIFLFTDGVTEANNVFGGMFGEKRLEEALSGERGLGLMRFVPRARRVLPTVEEICRRVRGAVDGFAGAAPQFDDITMLALRYRGCPEVSSLTRPATLESVAEFNAFAEAKLVAANCPQAVRADLLVALDEAANNIASYSGSAEMTLEIEIARDPSVARFRLIDAGEPWNPLDHLDPDVTLSADERAIGGLGILMVKKLMDDVSYARRNDRNIFAFRKAFGGKR